ncbi:hypothetical protein NM688_g3088 [Phlebia brevispora]|uniref:Uncharacterized protein n=1 Tax=Phlebia brevispora TaxID=194682 RepID=A0ACC1T6N6_9APHY|nr:hypothetical protein NM688_g3088 [Phlebia brevispora]
MQSTNKLSGQTMADVIELQGKEIARLRKELAQLTPLVATRVEDVAYEEEQSMDAPSYEGAQIVPFCSGRPHKLLKEAKKIVGKRSTVTVGKCFLWLQKYESGLALRPSGRLSKKGNWMSSTHKKMMRQNGVVTKIGGQWYYLGEYEYVSSEQMPLDEYLKLPTHLQEDLVALSGTSKHHKELARRLSTGEITVTKFYCSRVAFDNAFQDALLGAKAAELGLHGADDTGGSEEDEEEEND